MPQQIYALDMDAAHSTSDDRHVQITATSNEDPNEIHVYDGNGIMIAALDLFSDRIEVVRFGPDGTPADTLTIPAST